MTCGGRWCRRDLALAGSSVAATLFAQDDAAINECLHKPCVCVIGAFDGVHVGHQRLLARAGELARERGLACVVVTFTPDPAQVLAPDAAPSNLMTPVTRRALIGVLTGFPVLAVEFTSELSRMDYQDFVRCVLTDAFDVRVICVGTNFCLGAGGKGNVEALGSLGQDLGFEVVAQELASTNGLPVSATRIRGLLNEGQVSSAAELLGRPHTVFGRVVHGRGEGTAFGFPTANVEVEKTLLLPREGVYAGYVTPLVDKGDDAQILAYPAAINVGHPRSFEAGSSDGQFLEATLVGFDSNIYDAAVAVSFTDFLREQRKFDNLDELEATVLGNIDWVRQHLGEGSKDAGELEGGIPLDF